MSEENTSFPTVEMLEEELRKEEHKRRHNRTLGSTAFVLLAVLAAAVVALVLLMPVLRIHGDSMAHTLEDGDVVIVWKGGKYRSGDVVSFEFDGNLLVKRVIARGGDRLEIGEDGTVFVNGQGLNEPYVTGKSRGLCDIDMPCQVPSGSCFVLGDHRSASVDSRSSALGFIREGAVTGRLLLRVWPLARFGLIH